MKKKKEKKEYRLKYIKVKMSVPACPICEKELIGNGSLMRPYECGTHGILENSWNNLMIYKFKDEG